MQTVHIMKEVLPANFPSMNMCSLPPASSTAVASGLQTVTPLPGSMPLSGMKHKNMSVWTTEASKLLKTCQAKYPTARRIKAIINVLANMLAKTFLPAKYNQGNKCFCWWLGVCDNLECCLCHSTAPVAGMDDPLFGKVAAILNNYKPPNMEGGVGG
jgi:hypothetical protein